MYVLICSLFCALGYHNPISINIEIDLDDFNGNLDKLLISINDVELKDLLGEGIHNRLQIQYLYV